MLLKKKMTRDVARLRRTNMKLTPIVGETPLRCKKCADGTKAEYLIYFDAAKKEVPLCKHCAIDITSIFDLKVLQAVAKGELM